MSVYSTHGRAVGTHHGISADSNKYLKTVAIKAGRGTMVGRALLKGRIVQVPDVLADPEYTRTEGPGKNWLSLRARGSAAPGSTPHRRARAGAFSHNAVHRQAGRGDLHGSAQAG